MATKLRVEIRGGERFARKLTAIAKQLGNGHAVKVGFLAGANYPSKDGEPGLPVAQVALWNEFGTKHSPARPFMRDTIERESPRWGERLAKFAKATDYDGQKTMTLMGERMVGQIQRTINEFRDPPNAPATVKQKGFNKPLIETSHMLRSVAYEVTNGS